MKKPSKASIKKHIGAYLPEYLAGTSTAIALGMFAYYYKKNTDLSFVVPLAAANKLADGVGVMTFTMDNAEFYLTGRRL